MAPKLTVRGKAASDLFSAPIDAARERIAALGGALTNLGAALAGILTGPILLLAVPAVKAASAHKEATRLIAASTGAASEALAGLANTFELVRTDTRAGVQEAAEAVSILNQRLGLTGDQLQQAADAAIRVARAGGAQIAPAAEALARLMKAFGVSSGDVSAAMTGLVDSARVASGGIMGLAQSLTDAAPVFRLAGLSLADGAQLLAQLERAGVPTATAITGLRTALTKLSKEGAHDAAAALRAQIDAIRRAAPGQEATRLAMETFGQRAGPILAEAIRRGALAIGQVSGVAGGAVPDAGPVATLTRAVQDLWLQLQAALLPLGDAILRVLVPAMNAVVMSAGSMVDAFGQLTRQIATLPPALVSAAVILAGVVAIVGPGLLFVGEVASAIAGLLAAGVRAAGALGVVAAALAALLPAIGAAAAPVHAFQSGLPGAGGSDVPAVIRSAGSSLTSAHAAASKAAQSVSARAGALAAPATAAPALAALAPPGANPAPWPTLDLPVLSLPGLPALAPLNDAGVTTLPPVPPLSVALPSFPPPPPLPPSPAPPAGGSGGYDWQSQLQKQMGQSTAGWAFGPMPNITPMPAGGGIDPTWTPPQFGPSPIAGSWMNPTWTPPQFGPDPTAGSWMNPTWTPPQFGPDPTAGSWMNPTWTPPQFAGLGPVAPTWMDPTWTPPQFGPDPTAGSWMNPTWTPPQFGPAESEDEYWIQLESQQQLVNGDFAGSMLVLPEDLIKAAQAGWEAAVNHINQQAGGTGTPWPTSSPAAPAPPAPASPAPAPAPSGAGSARPTSSPAAPAPPAPASPARVAPVGASASVPASAGSPAPVPFPDAAGTGDPGNDWLATLQFADGPGSELVDPATGATYDMTSAAQQAADIDSGSSSVASTAALSGPGWVAGPASGTPGPVQAASYASSDINDNRGYWSAGTPLTADGTPIVQVGTHIAPEAQGNVVWASRILPPPSQPYGPLVAATAPPKAPPGSRS